jgi:hypothetical protein
MGVGDAPETARRRGPTVAFLGFVLMSLTDRLVHGRARYAHTPPL